MIFEGNMDNEREFGKAQTITRIDASKESLGIDRMD